MFLKFVYFGFHFRISPGTPNGEAPSTNVSSLKLLSQLRVMRVCSCIVSCWHLICRRFSKKNFNDSSNSKKPNLKEQGNAGSCARILTPPILSDHGAHRQLFLQLSMDKMDHMNDLQERQSGEHILLDDYNRSPTHSTTHPETDHTRLLLEHDRHAAEQLSRANIKSRIFNRSLQTRSLFFQQSLRWLSTIVLSVCIMATIIVYQKKGNFSDRDKSTYNVIFTGLSVGLGINFFVRITS